jgi:50S ribosomal subunit-associated GTPase HflX
MSKLSDFQKRFLLGSGAQQTLYTQKEFDEAVAQAKAEIMAIAIETSKQAVMIERQACAEVALQGTGEAIQSELLKSLKQERERICEAILNRIPSQRQ